MFSDCSTRTAALRGAGTFKLGRCPSATAVVKRPRLRDTRTNFLNPLKSPEWSLSNIPDLAGKTFIITGGNSGIGYECAKNLVVHGGHVIIATHSQSGSPSPADEVDGPGAVSKIKKHAQSAQVDYMECDLASFRSIHNFVEEFKSRNLPLHCLINNAGLQTPPDAKTEDGFEVTLGVNFFGPFYLTQLLLPVLEASAPSRIVWVSSPDEVLGETHWDDIRGDHYKTDITAYGTTKLWNLMVGLELNERLKGTGVESFACHPSICRTDLFRKADHDKMATVITDWAQWLAGQTAESGALAPLYCATAPEIEGQGGKYFGPYYKGPLTPNVFNTSERTPGHSDARDAHKRARLFTAAAEVAFEVAEKAHVESVGDGPVLPGMGVQGA